MRLAKSMRQIGRAATGTAVVRGGSRPGRNRERGSAIVIAMIMTILLGLLGLAYAMTAVTDSLISNSGRQAMNTYYIAEAGREEALNEVVTTPRTQFNPSTYSGSFPVDIAQCFYNDSSAPACPVTVGAGSTLANVPVSVATGKYHPKVLYLGHVIDADNMTLNKYLVFSTAVLNAANVNSTQTVVSQMDAESVEYAFPPHPVTSCLEPNGSGPWLISGYTSPGVLDPTAPATWPPGSDLNYGTTPMCGFPSGAKIQQAIETNPDFSCPSSCSNPAGPSTFWKVPPTGGDPRTGQPYETYVNGDLTINGNTTIYGVFYVTGNVTFTGSATVQGVIYAPNGTYTTGKGGGSPNTPDVSGGIYANGINTTGNHYYAMYNASYTNAYLGQIPYRLSRGGR